MDLDAIAIVLNFVEPLAPRRFGLEGSKLGLNEPRNKWRTSANALMKGGGLGSSWKYFTTSDPQHFVLRFRQFSLNRSLSAHSPSILSSIRCFKASAEVVGIPARWRSRISL